METQSVRCAFEITFEEFREAVLAIQRVNASRQGAHRTPLTRGAAALTIAILLAVAVVMVAGLGIEAFAHIRPPHYVLFTLLVPSAVSVTGTLVLARVQQVTLAEPRPTRRSRMARSALSLVPVIVLGIVFVASWLPHITERDESTGRPLYDWFGTVFPHLPWTLLIVVIFSISAKATRRQIERLWEQQPSLSRERRTEISAGGMTVDETVVVRRYEWPGLTRYIETERLMLACPSEVSFEIIPKRAFESAAQLQAARDMFQGEIRDRHSRQQGFDVLSPGDPRAAAE